MVKKYETSYGVIYNVDSRRLLEFVDENSVDLVYTDPPYGFEKKYGLTANRGDMTVDLHEDKMKDWAFEFPFWAIPLWYKVLKNDRWGFTYLNISIYGKVREELEKNGFNIRNSVVWIKKGVGFTPRPNFKNAFEIAIVFTKGKMGEKWRGGSRTLNVFESSIVSGNTKEYEDAGGHPSIKPIGLVKQHIPLFTDEGDVVLDMFAGSGTIPVVCEMLRRRWIAFEIDEKWFNVIVKRLQKYENRRLDEWW